MNLHFTLLLVRRGGIDTGTGTVRMHGVGLPTSSTFPRASQVSLSGWWLLVVGFHPSSLMYYVCSCTIQYQTAQIEHHRYYNTSHLIDFSTPTSSSIFYGFKINQTVVSWCLFFLDFGQLSEVLNLLGINQHLQHPKTIKKT